MVVNKAYGDNSVLRPKLLPLDPRLPHQFIHAPCRGAGGWAESGGAALSPPGGLKTSAPASPSKKELKMITDLGRQG
jgi:hypothetical protein